MFISKAFRMARVKGITQLIHEWIEPSCLCSQPQRITALWLVLIPRPTEGRRLRWPGCCIELVGCVAAVIATCLRAW